MTNFNYRVVSKNRIIENLKPFSSLKICAMVKGNAYGFGVDEMVALLKDKVDFFGVANIDEAMHVRSLCKDKSILIAGKTFDPHLCVKNNLSYAVCDLADAMYAEKGAKVHIKIDSGMNRLGFKRQDEMLTAIEILREKGANIEGVYTHFATLDCDHDFFLQQYARFKKFLAVFPKDLHPIIHVGGSWAMAKEIPEAQMIRIGKGIYHGAISIESRITLIKEIKKGERVGYANGFVADRNLKIGIVPVGYADGLKRSLSNNYEVLINGEPCKIVGNVCMDMFACDISQMRAHVGQKVMVMYDEAVMAKALKTSSYETTTNFNHLRGKTIIK